MARQHQPGFYFFPSDWRGDPCVGMCSASARGLWLEMLLIMSDADPRGFLVVNGKSPPVDKLAQLVRIPHSEVEQGLAELEENGVFSRTKSGIIYSRKMIRDEKKARIARENGKLGGNPTLRKQRGNGASDNLEVIPLPSLTYPNHTNIEESIKDSPPYGPPNGVDKVAPDGAPAAHAARDGRGQFSFMADDHSLESKAAAKPPKPSSKELDAAFEAFWSEVPTGRKFGKEACRRKVRRIISSGRCSPEDLLAKMHEYASGCESAGIEKSSIKLPETWLNKECYLDEEQFIPKAQQLSRYVDMCPKDAETGLRYVSKTTKMFLDMADHDRLHKGERLRVGL